MTRNRSAPCSRISLPSEGMARETSLPPDESEKTISSPEAEAFSEAEAACESRPPRTVVTGGAWGEVALTP